MRSGEMNQKVKKTGIYLLEFGKWALVLWLLYPALSIKVGTYLNPYRFIAGITLFIIFLGKTFYDAILVKLLQKREGSAKTEIFSMIGTVILITLAVALIIFLVGYMIFTVMGSVNTPVES